MNRLSDVLPRASSAAPPRCRLWSRPAATRPLETARWLWAVLLLLGAGFVLAACGGDEDAASEATTPADSARVRASDLAQALPAPPARVLLVHDTNDAYGQRAYRHAAQALRYAKQPFDAFDLSTGALDVDGVPADSAAGTDSAAARPDTAETSLTSPADSISVADAAPRDSLPSLRDYTAVLTATEYLWKMEDAEAARLRGYVDRGGGLAVLHRAWHDSLGVLFGASGMPRPSFREASERLTFLRGLMPGLESLTLPEQTQSFYAFTPSAEGSRPFVRADSSGRPVAWRGRYGEGRVVYWNAALLTDKDYRGFANQSLALVQPRTVRPMANWAAVFLDDFPAPAPGQKLRPIRAEFGLAPAAFYARQWYPDMRRLAREFDLSYTAAAVFSYGDLVNAPFRFSDWLGSYIQNGERTMYYAPWMSRQVAQNDEVALLGYNRVPLTQRNWSGEAPMIRAVDMSLRRWRIDVGAEMQPRVYVPPFNEIDSMGVTALQAAVPSVDVIAGAYAGERAEGKGREFGLEPWGDGALFALPRNTDGYRLTPVQRLRMLSLLHTAGVWNHYLRPTAVYENAPPSGRRDTTRATPDSLDGQFQWYGENESGLYHQFRTWLTFAREHYPWLRHMSASEAAQAMRNYNRAQVRWTSDGENVTLRADGPTGNTPIYVTVYSERDEQVAGVSGGEAVGNGQTAFLNYHVIRMENQALQVSFEGTSSDESTSSAGDSTGIAASVPSE